MSIGIIHFQPIEKYPPILNFLNYCGSQNLTQKIIVLTTSSNNQKEFITNNNQIEIKRFDLAKNKNSIKKILTYFIIYFNWYKILKKEKCFRVLYYETLSAIPVYFYKKIYPNTNIFIHYHEYTSLEEFNLSSIVVKLSYKLEKKMFSSSNWISHTNQTRLDLFLKNENIKYDQNKHKILPNYPSKNWALPLENEINNNIVKFVYFGALGLETMYLKEIANFINFLNGKATLDIYTNQYDEEAILFLKNLNCENIFLKENVDYFDIPQVIKNGQYNIGLILYKGHIPNYIYNAPNKLFEYLSCGLDVWFPDVMKGCFEYISIENRPFVIKTKFSNLSENLLFYLTLLNKEIKKNSYNLFAENIYNKLYEKLIYERVQG